jgi:2-hydroxychromene-2-carboxylate isomerase
MRLCFDFISPFAYLAWPRVHALGARHGRTVEPVPVLFAAALDRFGHLGPAEIPPKRTYVFKQCIRRAARAKLPFAPPPSHPFNPLLGLRVASLDFEPGVRRAVIDALFAATWGGGPGIESPAVVAELLDSIGLDGAGLVAAAGSPEIKARVRTQTDEAIAQGLFGVPTIFVDGELFWGDDSLDDLDDFLQGRDPVTAAELERWSALPASARRPAAAGT